MDWTTTMEYLMERSSRHGMTSQDLLDMTPESVSDCPVETREFWEQRDISHMKSQHNSPELADDPTNCMPEDPSTNRSRGSDDMTDIEIHDAKADNEALAHEIDLMNSHDGTGDLMLAFGF